MLIHPEVKSALDNHLPIVALESTIIAHGMNYPENYTTALEVEQIIRDEGAVPATIAILDGELHVGLTTSQLKTLATHKHVAKVSRRDIPYVVSQKQHGATTVAATMIIAEMAGIEVFATGGIGGVHRGAAETMDISADLQELSQTNVTVVSAGAKSILDLQLTLEYLETFGIPVIGFQTDEFPAFYSRNSGLSIPIRLDSIDEIANLIQVKRQLKLKGGIIIANPVPEAQEVKFTVIQDAITAAIKQAETHNIRGKELTPFLLAKIKDLTGGTSLKANIALVKNNAKLAAQISLALTKEHH